jgi:hypothetical protein
MGEMMHKCRTSVEKPGEDITPIGVSWVDENIAVLLPQSPSKFE